GRARRHSVERHRARIERRHMDEPRHSRRETCAEMAAREIEKIVAEITAGVFRIGDRQARCGKCGMDSLERQAGREIPRSVADASRAAGIAADIRLLGPYPVSGDPFQPEAFGAEAQAKMNRNLRREIPSEGGKPLG